LEMASVLGVTCFEHLRSVAPGRTTTLELLRGYCPTSGDAVVLGRTWGDAEGARCRTG
jgi:hypothetical protein